MNKDNIIAEVRDNRKKLFAKYDNDLSKYINELYNRQKLNKEKYVSRPNKKKGDIANN